MQGLLQRLGRERLDARVDVARGPRRAEHVRRVTGDVRTALGTFRHRVEPWLQQHGIALDTPAQHPFNPLALLRLAVACAEDGRPNRRVCEAIFRHVWQGGADANDPARLAALQADLAPPRDPGSPEVKADLKAFTEDAIAQGVFGVPSFGLDGRVFWGLDALPMVAGALQGDAWFDGPAWEREGAPRAGVVRR